MSPSESKKITSAFKAEQNRLLGYIRKKIRNGPDAEDILQDIFYQLTAGFNDIRRIESLTAWLYRVADNRIIDRMRRRKYKMLSYNKDMTDGEDGPLTLEEILPSAGSSPGDEELKEMIWMTIEKTLSDLPEEQRSVFVENEFEDLSFKEISERTGVGINTLISRKRYAVLALRKKLNELYKLFKTK
jgi:RNA polymerase sigma factor (sigma-70 family)